MTFVSIEIRAALLLLVAAVVPAAWAQDQTPATPEHVVGENSRIRLTPSTHGRRNGRQSRAARQRAPKLALLTPEQIEFLKSADARAFTGQPKKPLRSSRSAHRRK